MKTAAAHVRRFTAALGLLFVAATLSASAAIKQEIPDLRPPRDELPLENPAAGVLPWFVVGGVAVILIAAFNWPRPPRRIVPESPGARARRELHSATTPQAVAQILRHFLLAYFPLPGPGASTEEISESLYANIPSDPALAHQVTEFLVACDTEKFAPLSHVPGADPVAAVTSAGWAPKTSGAASATPQPPAGAAEIALSLMDKIEKRRHLPAPERPL